MIRVPAGRVARGETRVPPSKSVSHRVFNLALLSGRPVTVEHPLVAEDTGLFLGALRTLGWTVAEAPGRVELTPPASPEEAPRQGTIHCGNAGTMFRFLVATLATVPGTWVLDGIPRLRERPVGPVVDAVRRLGGRVECLDREGYAPLRITGGTLEGGETALDAGASSQYLSALLMAGLRARRPVTVTVEALTSEPYVDLTVDAVERFGGRVERPAAGVFRVAPVAALGLGRVAVEGDFSAAAYPAAAAALTGGSMRLTGLRRDSVQGDRRFLDVLAEMGAGVAWDGDAVTVTGGSLTGLTRDLSDVPDQVPTLAAVAPFAAGTTRITDVPHLRIKESDRLRAMAENLARTGVPVEELPAGLVVPGVWAGPAAPPADPVVIDPHGDHRIAMSLALVGLRRPGVTIADPHVVEKSYPTFWDDLAAWIGHDLE